MNSPTGIFALCYEVVQVRIPRHDVTCTWEDRQSRFRGGRNWLEQLERSPEMRSHDMKAPPHQVSDIHKRSEGEPNDSINTSTQYFPPHFRKYCYFSFSWGQSSVESIIRKNVQKWAAVKVRDLWVFLTDWDLELMRWGALWCHIESYNQQLQYQARSMHHSCVMVPLRLTVAVAVVAGSPQKSISPREISHPDIAVATPSHLPAQNN